MRREATFLGLSATDLANDLACRHLTELTRAGAERAPTAPTSQDPALGVLREGGPIYEGAYANAFAANWRSREPARVVMGVGTD